MNALHETLAVIGKSFEASLAAKELRMQAQKIEHAKKTAEHNALMNRTNGRRFIVINAGTLKPVGKGEPLCYSMAKHVRDTLDLFNTGEFLVKEVSK